MNTRTIFYFRGDVANPRTVPGNVQFVMIDGKEVLATELSVELDFGERYLWDDKVYLGEFDPSYQRTVRADSVPVTK